ncbi:MAG TPA: hypothetical protein VGL99_15445 [Chloroflexota bacterium]
MSEQLGLEKHCLVFGCLAEDRSRAVDREELSCQSQTREPAVQSVLGSPRGKLVLEVESEAGPGVTEEVVHCAKTVERSAVLAAQ